MANLTGIARPYAHAAFNYAYEHSVLAAWETFLGTAATIARDPKLIQLLNNPEIAASKLVGLFEDILSSSNLTTEQKNFLHLLANKKRLAVLPEIANLFESHCALLEKIGTVRVITAVSIDETFRQTLAQALSKRTQRDITLQCEVNPAIVGGAILHIGDKVIDGSVRGQLTRLLEFSLR